MNIEMIFVISWIILGIININIDLKSSSEDKMYLDKDDIFRMIIMFITVPVSLPVNLLIIYNHKLKFKNPYYKKKNL